MAAVPPPTVEAAPDGRTFTITRGRWSGTYPVEALPQWLRFYRGLRDRDRGAYATTYAPMVRALEDLARRMR